jgi:molecular chaperone HtpG
MNQEYKFEAEISQLLSIIINNFYSEKEIFLRELISNASDAIDKVRYQHLQNPENNVLGDETEFRIRVIPDNENQVLVVEDTGVGMTQEELIKNLGTIAHSGTKQFMDQLSQKGDTSLIGKFGVGFYSAFLVASNVDVYSRHYASDETYCWTSDAKGSFKVFKVDDLDLKRGTRLVLHLRDDQTQYLQENVLRDIISRHSQFISYPIYLQVTKEKGANVDESQNQEYELNEDENETELNLDNAQNNNNKPESNQENSDDIVLDGEEEMERFNLDEHDHKNVDNHENEHEHEHEHENEKQVETYTEFEVLNKSVPIWMKPINEISQEEYNEFYKTISGDWEEPLSHIHFNVEGNIVFKGLLYIPKKAPFDLFQSRQKMNNIKLYVRRVFITDECQKYVPDYLSFVKGVIDSDDLPLNVSREMLQYAKVFESIKKQLAKKVIDMLLDLANDEEKYNTFYGEFSKNIKLGVHEDGDKRQKLAKLLRYMSTKSEGKYTSLDRYVENMAEGQHDIYYISGENLESVASSTHLDIFRHKNIEVLFMTEAIDEYCVNQLSSYKEHNLVNVTRQNLELPESEEEKKKYKDNQDTYKTLCGAVKKVLGNNVTSVSITNRLVSEPCCVSVGQHGWTANMEKIMKAQAMSDSSMLNFMKSQRCFEINPDHRIIKSLNDSFNESKGELGEGAANLVYLLFETALQDAGFSVNSPRNYAHRVYSMVELGLGYTQDESEVTNNQPTTNNNNVNNNDNNIDNNNEELMNDEMPDLEQ